MEGAPTALTVPPASDREDLRRSAPVAPPDDELVEPLVDRLGEEVRAAAAAVGIMGDTCRRRIQITCGFAAFEIIDRPLARALSCHRSDALSFVHDVMGFLAFSPSL